MSRRLSFFVSFSSSCRHAYVFFSMCSRKYGSECTSLVWWTSRVFLWAYWYLGMPSFLFQYVSISTFSYLVFFFCLINIERFPLGSVHFWVFFLRSRKTDVYLLMDFCETTSRCERSSFHSMLLTNRVTWVKVKHYSDSFLLCFTLRTFCFII